MATQGCDQSAELGAGRRGGRVRPSCRRATPLIRWQRATIPSASIMPFPTRLKCKISGKLSYPVGAELISAQLADVPQAASFEISFFSKYERMKTRGEPYEILTVSYTPWEVHDSGWRIEVRPVPRELKHMVALALTTEFFPRIRQWLKAHTDPDGRYRWDSCGVIFDERHEPMFKWRVGDRLVAVSLSLPDPSGGKAINPGSARAEPSQ
jgi:hypothetical protein